MLFARSEALGRLRFRRGGQKKARQAKPGAGALRFRGSLNWSALNFTMSRYEVGPAWSPLGKVVETSVFAPSACVQHKQGTGRNILEVTSWVTCDARFVTFVFPQGPECEAAVWLWSLTVHYAMFHSRARQSHLIAGISLKL